MTPSPDGSPYSIHFDALLGEEGLTDPAVFAGVEVYDEVPLYSRLSQIEFLADLPVVERNKQLIRAAVRHLDRLRAHFLGNPETVHGVLRLVSVTGWWVDLEQGGLCTDGTSEIIRPNFWVGNLGNDRMKDFRLHLPTSRCASFVSAIVKHASHRVFESSLTESVMWCPRRVYVGFAEDIPSQVVDAP